MRVGWGKALGAIVLLAGSVYIVSGIAGDRGGSANFIAGIAGARENGLRLRGAADLTPLGLRIQDAAPADMAVTWSNGEPGDRLEALRADGADAVLLGYEASPAELEGLVATAVGSDAVAVLIDESTWEGGEVAQGDKPLARSDPLRSLSTDDLRSILSYYVSSAEERWVWPGVLWRWEPCAGKTKEGRIVHCIRPQAPTVLFRQTYEPGRFDTQTALYRLLGLDETALAAGWTEFTHADLVREEEVLASEYRDTALYAAGQGSFQFALSFASLPVAKLALRHVPVRVVTVDGIDPVTDPGAVIDGRYSLARKIYVVTRAGDQGPARALADWLTSPEGVETVSQVGLLAPDASVGAASGGEN